MSSPSQRFSSILRVSIFVSASSRSDALRARMRSCSSSFGSGQGKTRSSLISPMKSDLANEETRSSVLSSGLVVVAASMRFPSLNDAELGLGPVGDQPREREARGGGGGGRVAHV